MPEISIITVCYNSEKTIKRTLQAMLEQTFEDYEYIVVDGASTDNTFNILKEYEPLFGGKLRIISEPDKGIYDAMNKGISLAVGTIIGMVNSDDYYEKNALSVIHNSLQKEMIGIENHEIIRKHLILYGMERRLRNNQEIAIEFNHHSIIGESIIYHPACFVSKSVYEDFGMYNLKYKSAADLDFLIRIKQETDTKFIPVYEIISNFEVGGMSGSGVGAREAAEIRYRYGIYSRSRKNYIYIQSKLIDLLHKIKDKS